MLPTIAMADALYYNFMEYVMPFLICIAIAAVLHYCCRDHAEAQETASEGWMMKRESFPGCSGRVSSRSAWRPSSQRLA